MGTANILHMNPGNGESSYASNSLLQETVIRKTLPILRHTIKGITNHDLFFSDCFKIADLGCSSGKNTLLVASKIINVVTEMCKENNCKPPQFQVCLNDLFENDFNNLFKLLPSFYSKLKEENGENSCLCFISAVPGSFYGRLFADKSLHLVHSSYSLHWLSQVPEGLETNALNIYMAKTSPPSVFQAYGKQFKTDFTKFLQMRSQELVCGGHMVLTFAGRSVADPTSDDGCCLWELLAQSLLDLVKEGLVQETDINSFNVPVYYPCEDEVRNVIENEGSFSLECLTTFKVNWDPFDDDYKHVNASDEASQTHGENTAKMVRAGMEPLLASHFGKSKIDGLFQKYKKHVAQHQANNKTRFFNFVIALAKK
ncbi:putative methyltransferase [Helianthus debilis subsp. tardiflorus]